LIFFKKRQSRCSPAVLLFGAMLVRQRKKNGLDLDSLAAQFSKSERPMETMQKPEFSVSSGEDLESPEKVHRAWAPRHDGRRPLFHAEPHHHHISSNSMTCRRRHGVRRSNCRVVIVDTQDSRLVRFWAWTLGGRRRSTREMRRRKTIRVDRLTCNPGVSNVWGPSLGWEMLFPTTPHITPRYCNNFIHYTLSQDKSHLSSWEAISIFRPDHRYI
jgi:hypothetical protein